MHEIGIANSIIEAGQIAVRRRAGATLVRVGVRVGVLSGVNIEALRFAFMALTQGTELEAVDFEIEDCCRRDRCLACGCEFKSDLYSIPCPKCAAVESVLVGGDELDLTFVEVEEP